MKIAFTGVLAKTGYLDCSEAKAKFNFAAPKIRKYVQATVRMRRTERGKDLGLKAEKTALWSHPGEGCYSSATAGVEGF